MRRHFKGIRIHHCIHYDGAAFVGKGFRQTVTDVDGRQCECLLPPSRRLLSHDVAIKVSVERLAELF